MHSESFLSHAADDLTPASAMDAAFDLIDLLCIYSLEVNIALIQGWLGSSKFDLVRQGMKCAVSYAFAYQRQLEL